MVSGDLAKHIEALVDHLRKNKGANLTLLDLASVTEVLIGTTASFFKSVDTTIYRECRNLSEYIDNARKEIAALEPGEQEGDNIPRAGLELDAIVQHTEEATNTIMEAAEEIMGLDPDQHEEYVAKSQDAVMRIFEACSFQDITGQRISKVVHTLTHIEDRVLELRNLMGISEQELQEAREENEANSADQRPDKDLLRGPALSGEGIDQSAVDDLMGDFDAVPAAEAAAPSAEPAPAPAPAPKPEPAAKAEPPAAPAPPPPPKPVSPKVLDNMFEEDFDPTAELEAKKAEKAAEESAAEASDKEKKDEKDETLDNLGENLGEEVSQDDIDALFG